MTQLPNDLDEAIAQAREAAAAAVEDGYSRIQIELVIPELKVMPVAEKFLPAFEELGAQLRVFFPDPGAAALARRDWGEKPYAIRGIGELKAKIQPEETLFLFIEPSSVEVSQVEELCNEAGERPVVFLNPKLEDVATIGIGYAGRQLRERFLNTFDSCYYIRPMEGAMLFRCYPSPWQVWVESGDTYELVAEEAQKPIGEKLEKILMGASNSEDESPAVSPQPARKGLLSGLQQFLRALSQ
ncbi:MAG: DUF1995 family protein [Elainellaceae cyanobacterium]